VPRSPLRLFLQLAVMTALVGGTTAFVNLDKDLVLSIDGKVTQVHSFARTVGDVLAHQGIQVGTHDTVAPGRGATIADGTRIAVRFGRLITATVDGRQRKAWVTAINVQEALDQLGVRDLDAFVSVSRSLPIGRQGLAFAVRLPHSVTVDIEGKRHKISTTGATVADALLQADIPISDKDLVFPSREAYPKDGDVIKIFKIKGKVVTKTLAIPYETKHVDDNTVFVGDSRLGEPGKNGSRKVTYEFVRKNGEWVTKRTLFAQVVRKPVDRIIKVGIKPWPTTGAENLNWKALAACESNGNPRAVNPNGHYGLYQFSLSTWQTVGGSGNPVDASPEEQTYRAQVLYVRAGSSQWSCGSHLFD
jgi:resuscitation-promoting factor RpfB